jgi:hypothetical protein
VAQIAAGAAAGSGPPETTLRVDVVGAGPTVPATARVLADGWFPTTAEGLGDLAVLTLDRPAPPEVRPARLSRQWTGASVVRAYGFPPGLDNGVWAQLRVMGTGGPGTEWVQVDPGGVGGRRVERGFSGAGAVDGDSGDVLGLVIAADNAPVRSGVAWILPVEAMIGYWPSLAELVDSSTGAAAPQPVARRGEPRSGEPDDPTAAVLRLLPAVEALPIMADPPGRQDVLNLLPADIAAAAQRHSARRRDVMGILSACARYPGGLAALLDAVRTYEGGSLPMRALDAVVAELSPRWAR